MVKCVKDSGLNTKSVLLLVLPPAPALGLVM
jgi:hypothetical protein